jgi:sphingomyelin phosphodiesterase acid-like 3
LGFYIWGGIVKKIPLILCLALFWGGQAYAEPFQPWKLQKGEGNFLILSDIHFDPYADTALIAQLVKSPADDWDGIFQSSTNIKVATYGEDTNYPLWISCVEAIKKCPKPDYVIVNGDYLSHHFLEDYKKNVSGNAQNYTDFIQKTLGYIAESIQSVLPNVPIYFCLGNNDSDCEDYEMTPHSEMLQPLTSYWKTVSASTKAKAEFTTGGYYVVKHPTIKNQEFIVLNDVFWSVKYLNTCGKEDEQPGAEEMNWLKQQLDDARKDHMKVTVITHMPLGSRADNAGGHLKNKPPKNFWKETFFVRYSQMVSLYRDVVVGMFSGHTHMDDFKIFADSKGKAYLFDHITPSISPVRNNNPGFQMMRYDHKTGRIKDMATYYCDLSTVKPDWSLEYIFDQTYGLTGYDGENLLKLLDMIRKDPAMRAKYITYIPVSSTH